MLQYILPHLLNIIADSILLYKHEVLSRDKHLVWSSVHTLQCVLNIITSARWQKSWFCSILVMLDEDNLLRSKTTCVRHMDQLKRTESQHNLLLFFSKEGNEKVENELLKNCTSNDPQQEQPKWQQNTNIILKLSPIIRMVPKGKG